MAARPDDGQVPDYRFEPLPITITAVKGVKHCDFYEYQTADDVGHWSRDGLGRLVDDLRAALVDAIPDYRAAPWGWSAQALQEYFTGQVLDGQPKRGLDVHIYRFGTSSSSRG